MVWFAKSKLATAVAAAVLVYGTGGAFAQGKELVFGFQCDRTGPTATVGTALIGIVLFGSLAGSMLPFILQRVGFDPATRTSTRDGSFGLLGMQERAALVGATLEIESAVGRGTSIIVRIACGAMIRRISTPGVMPSACPAKIWPLSTPSTPMWPVWWWPQEFMQPLMCRSMGPSSYTASRSAKRSLMSAATGMERALARAQKSPPGQAMMSVIRPMLGVAKPASRAACQTASRSASRTQGSSRFWSCVTRSSPSCAVSPGSPLRACRRP